MITHMQHRNVVLHDFARSIIGMNKNAINSIRHWIKAVETLIVGTVENIPLTGSNRGSIW